MELLSKLFGNETAQLPQVRRVAYVYCNDSALVTASSIAWNRMQAPALPSGRFSLAVKEAELGRSINACIQAARIDATENEYDSGYREFFGKIGVRGWEQLEKKWHSATITELDGGQCDIVVFQQCPEGGYATTQEPTRVMSTDLALGEEVRKMLGTRDRRPFDDAGPSHT